ncbi:restriction endonuclease subunit S [Salinibacter sp.]|uniref:restriction endonuclease subunit S n=1 Tax=Salinibacter sp. TaxID=2065818 RepID=UPI0021E75416|nr:restriction endonuclease subunit S [Salinibacter sp.]
MSDDLDFEMEVVEDDELGSTASPSEGSIKPDDAANDDRSSTELVESKEEASSRFEGLPDAWAVHKLQEAAKVVGGSTPSTNNDEYWGGDMPWATPTDVTGLRGTTITETEDKITEEGLNSASTHILPEYSVLMTSRATIGACAVNTVPMATNQGFQSLVPGERLNTWYLFYRMLNEAPYLESLGAGSTFSEVSKRVVEKVDIPVPPLPEQRKIASVLYAVDQAIQKTEAIIEQTKRIKTGVAQDLFHSGTEEQQTTTTWLGEIPASWKVVRFSDIISTSRNGIYKSKEYYGSGYPIVKMGQMFGGIRLRGKGMDRLRLSGKEIEKYGLQEGDLLFARRSLNVEGAGKCTIVKDLEEETVFESSIIRVRLENGFNPMFYAQYFEGPVGARSVRRIVNTVAASGISGGDLKNLRVPVPKVEVQQQIASTLSDFDEKVEALKVERDKLSDLKKGLMQDLLTGEVRTADKAIEVLGEVKAHG